MITFHSRHFQTRIRRHGPPYPAQTHSSHATEKAQLGPWIEIQTME